MNSSELQLLICDKIKAHAIVAVAVFVTNPLIDAQ